MTEHFHKTGSPAGLAELERHLATVAGGCGGRLSMEMGGAGTAGLLGNGVL